MVVLLYKPSVRFIYSKTFFSTTFTVKDLSVNEYFRLKNYKIKQESRFNDSHIFPHDKI